MTTTGVFPTMVLQMAAIGEESGALDHMLAKCAEFYEDEVDEMVKGLSSLMEPFIIVILGVLIGGIVVVDVPADLQAGRGGLSAGMAPEFWFSPLALALLGLCVGSFLNVVAHRLPKMLEREWWLDVAENQLADADAWQRVSGRKGTPPAAFGQAAKAISDALRALSPISLSRPRSRCPSCGHVLRWHENLPLIGWLRLKGRCSSCGTRHLQALPAGRTGHRRCCSRPAAGSSAPSRRRWCGAQRSR